MKAITHVLSWHQAAAFTFLVNIKFAKHEAEEYGSDVQIEEVAT